MGSLLLCPSAPSTHPEFQQLDRYAKAKKSVFSLSGHLAPQAFISNGFNIIDFLAIMPGFIELGIWYFMEDDSSESARSMGTLRVPRPAEYGKRSKLDGIGVHLGI